MTTEMYSQKVMIELYVKVCSIYVAILYYIKLLAVEFIQARYSITTHIPAVNSTCWLCFSWKTGF